MSVELAGCLIADEQSRILLLHRNSPQRVQWETPGGKVEVGETAAEAALRELEEELGLQVSLHRKLITQKFTEDGKKLQYELFLADAHGETPRILDRKRYDELRYFSWKDLEAVQGELSLNVGKLLGAYTSNAISAILKEDSEDSSMMRLAIEQAGKSAEKQPCGCVLAKDGIVVGTGFNSQRKTHDATAHAEMNAIRHACSTLESHNAKGCTAYCTHEPCTMCLTALVFAGVKKLVYGLSYDEVWPHEHRMVRVKVADYLSRMPEKIEARVNFMHDDSARLVRR